MRAALLIACALLLLGCSAERRCARAYNRCAVLWQHDTLYIHDSIRIDRLTIDTVIKWNSLTIHDTVTIRNGRAVVRFVRLPGDSVWIEGECKDTVIRYVKQVVTVTGARNLASYIPWWVLIVAGVVCVWIIRRL